MFNKTRQIFILTRASDFEMNDKIYVRFCCCHLYEKNKQSSHTLIRIHNISRLTRHDQEIFALISIKLYIFL